LSFGASSVDGNRSQAFTGAVLLVPARDDASPEDDHGEAAQLAEPHLAGDVRSSVIARACSSSQ